jgi:microsomal dipeptidase-like Zn-dependent dipeptidase
MSIDLQSCLGGRAGVIDMHDHPSLKTYLFNKDLGSRHRPGGAFNPFSMRVDLPKIVEGGVTSIFSTIYLPEKGLMDDCWLLWLLFHLLPKKFRNLVKGNPFEQTMLMLDHMERAVARARVGGNVIAEVARSKADLCRIINAGKVAILHAIEGAHSLSGNIANVDRFFDRGVCLMTLAHFYENDVVGPVNGIPDSMKPLWCFRQEKDLARGLTAFGSTVVERMIDLGMIIDLTHSTPVARDRVFQINNKKRPLVFSHTGVQTMCNEPMNPTDDEIRKIADCGGVVGIIFMNYWLCCKEKANGLELIAETARNIKRVGGIETVAIGTDFDGFTDPPDDVKDMADIPKVADYLSSSGFLDSEIEKILGGNVVRVLDEGWNR